MSVKVKVKIDQADLVSNFFTNSSVQSFNNEVVDKEIKPQIASGTSPVRGKGRFIRYKNPLQYPGDKKGQRPVNLKLTGEMLSNYKAFSSGEKTSVNIGFSSSTPPDVLTKAVANNEGTDKVPVRRFLPLSGEQFNVSITQRIREWVGRRIDFLLKSKK